MPSGLRQVDRDAEVDVRRRDDRRLAVDLGVEDVLARELLERLDDRPADEVREADLAAARARHVVVDDDPVVDHELRRDGADARRGRDGQRLVHVGGEGLRHAAQDGDPVLLGSASDGGGLRPWAPAPGSAAGPPAGPSCAPRAARRSRGSAPSPGGARPPRRRVVRAAALLPRRWRCRRRRRSPALQSARGAPSVPRRRPGGRPRERATTPCRRSSCRS